MLSRHWAALEGLPLKFIVKLAIEEMEQAEERKAWQMWLAKYQYMSQDNFVPFSDFFVKSKPISQRPAEEIIAEAMEIRRTLGR